jgi:hypothetical protein
MIDTSLAMRLCGFLYIYILISNAASVGLGNRNNEFDSSTKMPLIAENPSRYRMSIIVAIISHLGILTITGMLFLAFNSYNRQLALIGSVFRLGEAVVMIYSEISIFRLLELSKDYVLTDSNKEALSVIGDQILQIKNSRVDLGLLFLSIGAIAYCLLFIQNGIIPSRIAWLGFAAGIISAIGILAKFLSGFNFIAVIGMVSMMVFETSFAGWLLFFSKT